jgi:periplasmic divalent cation tolerance protein
MTDKILVLSTAGSDQEASKIAQGLVERRLAACVNIVPNVRSIYRWQGKIEESPEYLLIIKTEEGRFTALRAALEEMHSYELPECIAVPISHGSERYLDWIAESTQSSG